MPCQQYIHSLSTSAVQTLNKYTYLTCDIDLTVYIVSIAIATIMSVTKLKTVKRFQQFSTLKSFPNYDLMTIQVVNYTFVTALGMVA